MIGLADDIALELAGDQFDRASLRDISTHFQKTKRRLGRLGALLNRAEYLGIKATRLVEDDAAQAYSASESPLRAQARIERELRAQNPAVPTVLGFFVLDDPAFDPAAVKTLIGRLRELMKPDPATGKPDLETAYVEQGVIPAGPSAPAANAGIHRYADFQKQDYLSRAGINLPTRHAGAEKSWWESYDGSGIQFIDIERGWNVDHEAFGPDVRGQSRGERDYAAHGAGVLGIVRANGEKSRIRGIAPGCTLTGLYALEEEQGAAKKQTENAIRLATDTLVAGDVILLALQTTAHLPVETDPGVFKRIQIAVAKGIVVVEAAGNSGAVLEDYANDGDFAPGWSDSKVEHRIHGIPDSGAIIVGGCEVATEGAGYAAPNQDAGTRGGARVDCCAWSQQVWTSYSDDAETYAVFTGTSAASPIIAGLAIVLQHCAQKHLLKSLTPSALRDLLRDPTYGKAVVVDPAAPSAAHRPPVNMPDASKLFERIKAGPA